ncbi:hypothetical protein [Paenibacillus silvisoli]|uniref:hypothetical protein n=1 Tax=Paenibacillus silvisoli TaxID=3110539 RepID=UPI0028040191|nr:hypothetical protein [Paenibacillus silvisoli]
MIDTWWWKGLGMLLFAGMVIAMFLNMYEIKIVREKKEKMPSGNWTFGKNKTIGYLNYNTVRHVRQRRIS